MKKWYVGVDGGGTKTAAAISLEDGKPVVMSSKSGCSYQAIGINAASAVIVESITECLASMDATLEDCAGCCLGVPCFGENAEQDAAMAKLLEQLLAPAPLYIVNDVEVGWAGALNCQPGIHIVSGTGAIAFGKGSDLQTARCGGWNEFFGDEGSAYWVGRETMSLFSKEADGRLPKGPLYEIVKAQYRLSTDMDFIDIAVKELAPHRDRVAAFQRYACEAAKSGDTAVIALYGRAAHELALLAKVLKAKLLLPAQADVSYSGGLFHAGEFILNPLAEELSASGCTLCRPAKTALEGALALSIKHFKQEEVV